MAKNKNNVLAMKILETLKQKGELSITELSVELREPYGKVYHTVTDMEKKGLVKTRRRGQLRLVRLA